MQKVITTIVILLLGVASFLRLDGVLTKSFAFTYDVGRDLLALNNFAHGHLTLIGFTTGLPGVFYGPWWYVFLLPSFLISQGDPVGVAGFLAGIGIVTVILLYFLGKKIGDTFLSLAILGLAAVSPKLIALSSQIWNPNIAPLWLVLLLLIVIKIFHSTDNKQQIRSWLIAGLLVGLLFEAEIVFGTLFLSGFVVFIMVCLRRQITLARIMSFFLGGFVILSPRILFEFRHQFLMTKAAIAFFSAPSAQQAYDANVFVTRAQFILSEWATAVAQNNIQVGIVIFIATLLVIIFYWKKLQDTEKLITFFVLITTGVAYLILLVFHHDLWPHYLVGYPVLWILLVAIALSLIYRYISRPLGLILATLLIVYNLSPMSLYDRFTKPLFIGDAAPYRNQVAVVDTIYSMAHKRPFAYIVYTPPIQDYTYQYLFSWYGKKTYGYVPQGNPNLLFAIIEPDFDHPTLEREWIASHASNGTIIEEKKLQSGIIVQKRITR